MRGEGSIRSLRRGKIRSKPFEESFTQTSSSTIIHSLPPLVIYTSHHRLKVLEISVRQYVVVVLLTLCARPTITAVLAALTIEGSSSG